ncbi:hypothetical protein OAG71_00580 [bacterium]|nr:hypothetical protein [bacterium]
MNKRTLNTMGWALLFPACFFAVGGIASIGFGVSITMTIVFALASIALFYLGGNDRRHCT